MSSSVKCSKCGLVNFSADEKCKRCDADLKAAPRVSEETAVQEAQQSRRTNLIPCADCGFHHSKQAEACPQCGRFIQRVVKPELAKGAMNLSLIALALWVAAIVTGFIGFSGAAFGLVIIALGFDIRSEIVRSRQY